MISPVYTSLAFIRVLLCARARSVSRGKVLAEDPLVGIFACCEALFVFPKLRSSGGRVGTRRTDAEAGDLRRTDCNRYGHGMDGRAWHEPRDLDLAPVKVTISVGRTSPVVGLVGE